MQCNVWCGYLIYLSEVLPQSSDYLSREQISVSIWTRYDANQLGNHHILVNQKCKEVQQ
ncbi:hypothetical protein [Crinalium epipsammum]|uniref:hypothetical protein n=1 Tax=Crinalium epipsammum TaxID=241425 RepID=UPI00030B1303|nr:hypothetical protein [Crinalium epipsammum]